MTLHQWFVVTGSKKEQIAGNQGRNEKLVHSKYLHQSINQECFWSGIGRKEWTRKHNGVHQWEDVAKKERIRKRNHQSRDLAIFRHYQAKCMCRCGYYCCGHHFSLGLAMGIRLWIGLHCPRETAAFRHCGNRKNEDRQFEYYFGLLFQS